jgi:hypothetical protein
LFLAYLVNFSARGFFFLSIPFRLVLVLFSGCHIMDCSPCRPPSESTCWWPPARSSS